MKPWAALAFLAGFAQATAAVNSPAPAFTLPNTNHQARTLKTYKGRVVVIDFWASWCAGCRLELPELDRLAGAYPQSVRVVAINVDTDRNAAEKLLAQLHISPARVETLWDRHSKAVSAYDIASMPSSFILDQHGVIRFAHTAYRAGDPLQWRREINSLLKK